MLLLEPEIDAEFHRILAQLPDTIDEAGLYGLGVVDVLQAHFALSVISYGTLPGGK